MALSEFAELTATLNAAARNVADQMMAGADAWLVDQALGHYRTCRQAYENYLVENGQQV